MSYIPICHAPARLSRKASCLSPRNLILAAALAGALAGTGCAENGLDTGALQITDPAVSTVTRENLPPPTAGAEVTSPAGPLASAPAVPLKPETAAAIRDARALRAAGNKARALGMLEKTAGSDTDKALLLERGLLSLELGQIDRAVELLTAAHDPKAPDWRQHSGLGAALSAKGQQQDAQGELAKALELAPNNPAVLNNLALSFALDGKHTEAERLLRQAATSESGKAQARQNLALILGLRGNIEESRRVSEAVLPAEKAKANVAYLERLKSGTARVSKAETVPAEAIQAAAAEAHSAPSDAPIMQLSSQN
ncbi:MAG: tetratricopeptide repeat protein [Hyphomicrobium sp.]